MNAIAHKGWAILPCRCRKGKGGATGGNAAFRVYILRVAQAKPVRGHNETALRHFHSVAQATKWIDAWDAGAHVAPRGGK